jgi:type I restriction enzyme, S subunit
MKLIRKKIGELSINVTDGEHGTVIDDINGKYFLLSNKNIKNSRIIYDESDRKITQSSFQKINKRTKLAYDDVVIATVGSIGRTAIIRENELNYDFQRSVGIIKTDKTKLSSNYLHYYFQLPYVQNRLKNLSKGAVQKCLFISDLIDIDIDIPEDFSSQQNISKILSDFDSKIELNNKINAELEAIAKLFYDYWFVQFDFPISAAQAASMGKPELKGRPYKSSGSKMVFNEELKREIPEEWGVDKIENILDTDLGGTPSTKVKKYWDGEIPWLNSGEIANFPIIMSEEHITAEAISNSAASLMPSGTCVLSITRHLRPSILAVQACANQSVVGIYESEKLKASYIYPFLKNEIPRFMSLRTGAQQPHINKGTIDKSLIINPSNDVLQEYYSKVNSLYKKIINNAFQNQQLASLRNWLLPMLMNGQVKVN